MAKEQEQERQDQTMVPVRRRFTDLMRWEREMDRLFDRVFDDFFPPRWSLFPPRWSLFRRGPFALRERAVMPSVDIDLYEKDDEVIAKAELPGMSKEEVSVNISDHVLTLKGEKKKEQDVKEEDYYYSERSYGGFVRTVELPTEVQTDKAKATFKDGVLEIRMPKTEEAKKKAISVKIE